MAKKAKKAEADDLPLLLEARGITKIFGELRANDAVDLNIKAGEIHALLGENGAGKSTLVKILFGSLQPNEGQIIWRGAATAIRSPSEARALGIGMVFQHFSLFEALSVAENIALSSGTELSLKDIEKQARELSQQYGLPLDPRAIVGDLSVGQRQRVEIIRCLMQNPALIILDEPTSVLTPQEADTLFKTLHRLASEGRSILYISHRLEEVKQLCSTATIMRHGKVVDACDPRKETAGSLASKMVGAKIADVVHREGPPKEEIVLDINNLSMPAVTPFSVTLQSISLQVHAGEIVGIAGIAGNGQNEFFEAVSGEAKQKLKQTITINGKAAGWMDISERRKLESAFIPEERLGHGAVPGMTLSDNMLLARHASDPGAFVKFGKLKVLANNALRRVTRKVCEAIDVRKLSENPAAGALSGGNLQKFIVGRELDRQPKLLVVNQPTWGVDAGAAAFIRQSLIDLAASGSAVLMVSQDLDEIYEVASSIAVMSDGKLSQPVAASKITRQQVGLLMAGGEEQAHAA